MNQLDLFFRRRSIRKYTDQPVSDEIIEDLLQAAMAAPTARNLQPWQFVVVREADVLAQLRAALPFGKINAPCAVCVCGGLPLIKRLVVERFWQQDCSAATENILLAATAMGLGSVWCGVYPLKKAENGVREVLALPKDVLPLNVIFLGYPAEEKLARTQYDPAKIFRDTHGTPW